MDARTLTEDFRRRLGEPPEGDLPAWADAAETALSARERYPWAAALGEEDFLSFVACPRVNDEPLAPCRALFARELSPLLAGLSWEQAVLAVNRWCAGQVTYRFNDAPTADALTICRRGHGRCGEETVFAVNALRSVGMAARQVYAVWWAHCDDNHAWVEVFDGAAWHCLGACEPEPVLDRGWFTAAASRAVLIRWKDWDPAAPEGFHSRSVTERYAATAPLTVTVADAAGAPLAGARVTFSLLNTGSLRELTHALTDENGRVTQALGRGTVWVTAAREGLLAEAPASVGETPALTLIPAAPGETPWVARHFAAPAERPDFPPPLTEDQRELRAAWLAQAAACRAARPACPEEPAPTRPAPAPAGPCRLTLTAHEAGLCRLSHWTGAAWQELPPAALLPDAPVELAVPAGLLRLLTAVRLPSGDQLARTRTLLLEEGAPGREQVEFPRPRREELLLSWPLPPFSLGEAPALPRLEAAPATLLAWLDPPAEPTQHFLTELPPALPRLAQLGCPVVVITAPGAPLPEELPGVQRIVAPFGDTVELLARRLYADPDQLPLVLLADRAGRALYRSAGYRAGGVGELLAAAETALDFPGEIPYNETTITGPHGKES